MKAGTKGRTRPLILEITNSGYDKATVCWEHHDYSVKVLQGVLANDAWFAFIAALDEEDEPFDDEACWPKANPNLGISITAQYLRTQVREAEEIPSQRSLVLRLNFCRWTEASQNWGDLAKWDLCNGPVAEEELKGRTCYGGVDLASVSDITAGALVFPPVAEGERWKLLTRFWLPEETIARRVQKARLPYDQWAREGWIRATPGNVTDYAFIKRQVLDDRAKFDLKEVAIDRWNATHITNELLDEGVVMVLFGQGFASMSAPMKELERLYTSLQIAHGANPVLRWMFSNVVSKSDPAGNIKPDRAASTEKIDGIVALIMALGRAMAAHNQVSVYAERGVLSV
jgi:phage terminase large subunit-like protein